MVLHRDGDAEPHVRPELSVGLCALLTRAGIVEGVPDEARIWLHRYESRCADPIGYPAEDNDAYREALYGPEVGGCEALLNRVFTSKGIDAALDAGEAHGRTLARLYLSNQDHLSRGQAHEIRRRIRRHQRWLGRGPMSGASAVLAEVSSCGVIGLSRPARIQEWAPVLELPAVPHTLADSALSGSQGWALGSALGGDLSQWQTFLALAPSWPGSIGELVRAVRLIET